LDSISNGLRHSDLVWLRCDGYPYTSLPVWIPKKNLRVLEVTGAELETLWQTENEAPLQLRELNIRSTLLRVPESIGQLRYLEKIDLSGCRDLQTLPPSLGNLANLNYMNLNGCFRLENLPDSFGNLSRLQHLSLAGCSISSIPFGNIMMLDSLDLSNCRRLEALPPQVTDQRPLKELNLKHTNLTELPIAIGNLSHLEILKLQCPLLEMLPSSLGKLTSLEELTLHFCEKLRRLPESVGELAHLTTLTIHYAQIEYLPVDVMRLNNLEILKVTGCPLLEVPFCSVEKVGLLDSSIDKGYMIRLTHLDLQGTRLQELSFCEGVCPNLQRLNVSYCHELVVVGALPTTLISLDLQECPALKEIKGLLGLAELRLLDISGCDKIEDLPDLDALGSLELRADGCDKLQCMGKIHMNMRRKSRDSSDLVSGKKRKP
jgi:Leucine-rich repeat (LRR) protein